MIPRRALLAAPVLALAPRPAAARPVWTGVTADAGYGALVAGIRQGDALLLRDDQAGGRALLRWPWNETPPMDGDSAPPPDETAPIAQLAANATDPLVPVRDGPFWSDPARWLLWREGATIHAADTALRRKHLAMAEPPAAILHPPLQRAGGPVELFLLAASRTAVLRVSLPRDATTPMALAATIPLPAPAVAGCAAFAPDGGTALGLCAQGTDGMTLLLAHAGGTRQALVRGGRPISPPVLLADAAGFHFAVMVATQAGPCIAEAIFPAGQGVPQIALRPLGLPTVQSAALVYIPAPAGAPRAHAVAIGAGRFHAVAPGRAAFEFRPDPAPVTPLVLVPGARGPLLLCCDPVRGPSMLAI